MLDVLRRNAGSWAIKGILTFIALTFIWWGVGSYSQSRRDVAATIGEEKISMAELAEAHAGLEKTYRDVYGSAFTPEMAKALDLRRQDLEHPGAGAARLRRHLLAHEQHHLPTRRPPHARRWRGGRGARASAGVGRESGARG